MPHICGKPHRRRRKLPGSPEGAEVLVHDVTGAASTSFSVHSSHVWKALDPIWICSVTGLEGLTYEEAVQNEKQAMEVISKIQPEFGIPLLYLASRTQCVQFTDMIELLSEYIANRYFVGETVDVKKEDGWYIGIVVEVHTSVDNEGDASQRSGEQIPAKVFFYTVVSREDEDFQLLVEASCLRRRRGEESIGEYLALFSEKSPNGFWQIRDRIRRQYGLKQYSYEKVFWGTPPCFPVCEESSDSNKEVGKKVLQVTLERYFGPHSSKQAVDTETQSLPPYKKLRAEKDVKLSGKSKAAEQRKVGQTYRRRDHLRRGMQDEAIKVMRDKDGEVENGRKEKSAAALEEKEKKRQQSRLEKAKLKDEKRQLAVSALEEKQQLAQSASGARQFKEDLECDDLKVLPTFSEVQCCIPSENFADFMVLLEFLDSFKEVLPVKLFFPNGISFEVVERALSVEEGDGTFSDIVRLLMTSIFNLQEVEDEDVDEPETRQFGQLQDLGDDLERALELAAATRNYTRLCHGVPLRKFSLDSFSISEVVRLHLLTSGGYSEEKRAKWRCTRGGYSERDDPGLTFCIAESELLNEMAYRSIQELAIADKLKIILCLIHQLLTYPSVRDTIDKRGEKSRQVKMDLRHQLNEVKKKKRDSLTLRLKEIKGTKPKGVEEMPSDVQHVVTDEDSEDEQIRIEKEILHKQQEATKTAKELAKIAMGFHVLPLGNDRFFRTYWVFSSLPGLFVEHRGDSIEHLSPGATYKCSSPPVRDIGENPASSDKENDDSDGCKSRSSNSPTKKMLAENNSSASLTSEKLSTVQQSNKGQRDPKGIPLHQNMVSTTSHEFLASSEPVWSFCCKEEDFNLLLERLNARGIREGPLRQVLQKEKERILESVVSCPAFKLNPAHVDTSNVPEVRKSSRNNAASNKDGRNFGYPVGTPLPLIWCEVIRDEILELEDRLYLGGLGSMHVRDRDAWRDALLEKIYDKQCYRLMWGCQAKSDEQENSRCSIERCDSEDIDSHDAEIHMALKSPFLFPHLSPSDPVIIKAYACAILQVEQGIPRKNMKSSFVADKPTEEMSQLERWEMSLMNSTSYSQLYVHLLTLNNSIHWSKSALKAGCRACRRRCDPEKTLLCDECNRAYHIYCLKPKLNRIPHGDWYCAACVTKAAALQNRKQHISISEEPEANWSRCKSPADRCDVCGLGNTSFLCTTCHRPFHVECCDPTTMKRTKSSWQCRKCSLREEEEEQEKGSRLVFSCQEAHGLVSSESQAELSSVQIKL